jgi:hypothetical protein
MPARAPLGRCLAVSARHFAALAVAVALGACASQPMIWDKDGATQADFNQSDYACRRDAVAAGGMVYVGFGITERTADIGMYQLCMRAAGFTLRGGSR